MRMGTSPARDAQCGDGDNANDRERHGHWWLSCSSRAIKRCDQSIAGVSDIDQKPPKPSFSAGPAEPRCVDEWKERHHDDG
jgi:hypothetical protein